MMIGVKEADGDAPRIKRPFPLRASELKQLGRPFWIAMGFLFILLLEDFGYMARAAFLMDRIMGGAGLHGRAFIPLLSSFACAIPGIMAARTIADPRDHHLSRRGRIGQVGARAQIRAAA